MWRSFPSDAFIARYYGQNRSLSVYSMPSVTVEAHKYIRREFGTVFFTGPKHLMIAADRSGKGFENIYTFKKGALSQWAEGVLKEKDMLEPLTSEAQAALFEELKQLYEAGGFPKFPGHDWWHWCVTEDSISIVLAASANPMGGNMLRRALDEMIGDT